MYSFITNRKLTISILLFLVIFTIINAFRPGILYNYNGSFRQFGIGQSHTTILPIWLFTILISIISYMIVLYGIVYWFDL